MLSVKLHSMKIGTYASQAVYVQKDGYDLEAFFLVISL